LKHPDESPLERAQHELAVEKYKNALLREKEAEREMKETEYSAKSSQAIAAKPPLQEDPVRNHFIAGNGRRPVQPLIRRGRPAPVVSAPVADSGAGIVAQGHGGANTKSAAQGTSVASNGMEMAGHSPPPAVPVSNSDWTKVAVPKSSNSDWGKAPVPKSSKSGWTEAPVPKASSSDWTKAPVTPVAKGKWQRSSGAHKDEESLPVTVHSSAKQLNMWAEGKAVGQATSSSGEAGYKHAWVKTDPHGS